MKRKINLQLFADGGAGAGTGASAGIGSTGSEAGEAATGVLGDSPVSQKGGDLSDVVYGKSDQTLAQSNNDVNSPKDIKPEDRQKAFDNMIKKGGEYAEEFNKRTQAIIDKRFKETKGLQEQLEGQKSIMEALAAKYGVDSADINAISKAIDADNSMWEEAAYKEGLSVEAYKQKMALERENAQLREAQEQLKAQQGAEKIYSQWLEDAEAVKQKYGWDFDMATELENKDFTDLLGAGVQFEAAFKAIHMDEIVNGAMAKTAQKVSEAVVNNVRSRASRPNENGIESSNARTFKSDPNQFTDADMEEIARRVEAGERIVL
ncbi:hypothetical protein [Pseudobutyrivibrio sp.]